MGRSPYDGCAESFFFFWLTAKNVSRDRREFRGFGLNCGGNTEDIAVELAIEEMCAGCYCARPGMRRGLICDLAAESQGRPCGGRNWSLLRQDAVAK